MLPLLLVLLQSKVKLVKEVPCLLFLEIIFSLKIFVSAPGVLAAVAMRSV